jgi:hypothetical protein
LAEPVSSAPSSAEIPEEGHFPMMAWHKLSALLGANVPGWPKTRPGLQGLAERRRWERRNGKGRGRKNFEYALNDLRPEELEALIEFEKKQQKSTLPVAVGTNFEAGARSANLAVPAAAGTISVATPGEVAAVARGTLDERESKRTYYWERFERKSKARKDEATRRAVAVVKVKELIKLGWPAMKAYESVAAEYSVGATSLRGWISDVGGFDASDYAAVLVDKR